MSMLAFHPKALFGSAEQQGCVQDLCPAQRAGSSLYRDCPARSARKGDAASGQGQPPPLPHSELSLSVWAISNPWSKGCVMCPVYLPWRNKILSCAYLQSECISSGESSDSWSLELLSWFFPSSNRIVTSNVCFLTFLAVFSSLWFQLFLKVL